MAEENQTPTTPYATPGSDPTYNPLEEKEVSITVIESLGSTNITSMICAVVGFIAVALIICAGAIAGALTVSKDTSAFAILFLIAIITFFVPYFTFRYSRSLAKLKKTQKEEDLVKALQHQNLFWGYTCILTCLFFLALFGMIF